MLLNMYILFALMAGFLSVDAATTEQWRTRSIYQLLTDRFARTDGSTTAPCNTADANYCGGTWRGIINHLDYIQKMGFTAVWISPVTYPIQTRTQYGMAWHGYWQQDLYRLNDQFGTADDLRALSQALHDRGMYLMVDVVTNHFGWGGPESGIQYADFYPFNDQKYFHNYCPINNYNNQTNVEECWLGDASYVPLADVRTEDTDVVGMYGNWIRELVANYSIDGLRIDTAKHVDTAFWSSFNEAASVFSTGEIYSGDATYVCSYQSSSFASVINYPAYFNFMSFLNATAGDSSALVNSLSSLKSTCRDVSALTTFTENHDVPRFASGTQDMALAKNAIALPILWDGIPVVYAGQEQHYAGYADPANREATWLAQYSTQGDLYKVAAAANQVRNVALAVDGGYATYNIYALYSDARTVALRKGYDGNQIVSVLTNLGANNPAWTLQLSNTGWSSGTVVVDVLTCSTLTVDGYGGIAVPMSQGQPRIYFAQGLATSHGICSGSSRRAVGSTSGKGRKRMGLSERREDASKQ